MRLRISPLIGSLGKFCSLAGLYATDNLITILTFHGRCTDNTTTYMSVTRTKVISDKNSDERSSNSLWTGQQLPNNEDV